MKGHRILASRWAGQSGFSFIELMFVLAMLAVLAGLATPVAQLAVQRHKEAQLREALRDVRRAIDQYRDLAQQGAFHVPPGGSGYPPTLEVLADGVVDIRLQPARRVYLLRRIPRDPFADDATLSDAQTWRKRSYASSAAEPREGADVFDIHSGSERVGLNGQPYRLW